MAIQTPAERKSGGQPSGIMPQLPLRELGLKYVPAVPVDIGGMADTLSKLVLSGSSSASRPSRASPRRSRSADRPLAPITSSLAAEQPTQRRQRRTRTCARS